MKLLTKTSLNYLSVSIFVFLIGTIAFYYLLRYQVNQNVNIELVKSFQEKESGKIKLTGNTIKSKKLQQYVVEFLDEGLEYLLNDDGLAFIELYYSYVEKIFNQEIPLSKACSKSC